MVMVYTRDIHNVNKQVAPMCEHPVCECTSTMTINPQHVTTNLRTVPIAKQLALRIQHIPDSGVHSETIHCENRIRSQPPSIPILSIDARRSPSITILPSPEVPVDIRMMQPKHWICWRCVNILHDGADAVVTPSMRSTFATSCHVGVRTTRITSVSDRLSSVRSLGLITVARQAMTLVARPRTNVRCQEGKLSVVYAVPTCQHRAHPLRGENARLLEAS
jgi:hypothetical protein